MREFLKLIEAKESSYGPASPKSIPRTMNQKHAAIQISGELEVLTHYKELASLVIELMQVDPDDDVAVSVHAFARGPARVSCDP